MKQKIKTILQTLMAVMVILFVSGIWYVVSAEKNEALHAKQEIEIRSGRNPRGNYNTQITKL